jgi:hypothetical protein
MVGADEDDPEDPDDPEEPEDPEDPDDPDDEEPVEEDPVEEEPVEDVPVEEGPVDDCEAAGSEPDPLAPQPAVMPRRRAQSTNVPARSAPFTWSYDIRLPSIVNAESGARGLGSSDQGITVDDELGAKARSPTGNPAISSPWFETGGFASPPRGGFASCNTKLITARSCSKYSVDSRSATGLRWATLLYVCCRRAQTG